MITTGGILHTFPLAPHAERKSRIHLGPKGGSEHPIKARHGDLRGCFRLSHEPQLPSTNKRVTSEQMQAVLTKAAILVGHNVCPMLNGQSYLVFLSSREHTPSVPDKDTAFCKKGEDAT
jgi:hypothetical protein